MHVHCHLHKIEKIDQIESLGQVIEEMREETITLINDIKTNIS